MLLRRCKKRSRRPVPATALRHGEAAGSLPWNAVSAWGGGIRVHRVGRAVTVQVSQPQGRWIVPAGILRLDRLPAGHPAGAGRLRIEVSPGLYSGSAACDGEAAGDVGAAGDLPGEAGSPALPGHLYVAVARFRRGRNAAGLVGAGGRGASLAARTGRGSCGPLAWRWGNVGASRRLGRRRTDYQDFGRSSSALARPWSGAAGEEERGSRQSCQSSKHKKASPFDCAHRLQ
jgi:hypothetical protein